MINDWKSTSRVNIFFNNLEKYKSHNIFVYLNKNNALKDALSSDKRLKKLSILDGNLIAIKPNIKIKSFPFTAGIKDFQKNISNSDDPLVRVLKDAGTIIIGLTNMDEAAFGGDTSTSYYGVCRNPINSSYSVGGSSGGSAAAISSGLVKYSIGTDTMGSVRIPSSYCGITGFKPSSILNTNTELLRLSHTYDTIGFMAKKVNKIKHLFDICNKKNNLLPIKVNNPIIKLKCVIPLQILKEEINHDVLNNFKFVISKLIKSNISIEYKELKYWKPNDHRKALLKIVESEGSMNLKELLDTNKSQITNNLRKNLFFGKNLNEDAITNIMYEFKRLKNSLDDLFKSFDIILMPTTPQSSFNKINSIPENQANYTSLANIADLPSISLPIFEEDKMPFSLQLLSSNMNDKYLLKISSYFEKILQ